MALGCIGLSYEDFCGLDYDELAAVMGAWRDMKEQESRSEWERMRVLAAITVQPHCGKRVTPSELVPLPWDENARKHPSSGHGEGSTVERFKELSRRANLME